MTKPQIPRIYLLIMTVMLTVGLAGPVLSVFVGGPTQQPEPTPEAAQDPNAQIPQPQFIRTVSEYSGIMQGTIIDVQDRFVAIGVSDLPNSDELEDRVGQIEGVDTVNVVREVNTGEEGLYVYTFQIFVDTPDLIEFVAFKMSRELSEVSFSQMAVPATIELPETFNLTDSNTGEIKEVDLTARNADVVAVIFPYSKLGDTHEYSVVIGYSSGRIANVQAVEQFYPFTPDSTSLVELLDSSVQSLDGNGVVIRTPITLDVNASQLQAELSEEQGFDISANFRPAADFFKMVAENATLLEQELQENGVSARTLGNTVYVQINKTTPIQPQLDAIQAASVDKLEIEVPKGTLELTTESLTSLLEVAEQLEGDLVDAFLIGTVSLPETIESDNTTYTLSAEEFDNVRMPLSTTLGQEITVEVQLSLVYDDALVLDVEYA